MKSLVAVLIAGLVAMIAGCSGEKPVSQLGTKISRFAPTPVTADLSRLSAREREVVVKLAQAAKLMDAIYARQVWSGNEAMRHTLEADKSAEGQERLHYYNINCCPWSILDQDEPFVPGAPRLRPPGANYYPEDMTKEEFTAWVETLPDAQKKAATGFFTVIRRTGTRALSIVPYSQEYSDLLLNASKLLKEAADLADDASLKAFLAKRAEAFLSNDYYE
ncbi:MAG TPA: hypothetical protein VMM80_01140, partial [Bacteroidota bacterium]|nr:hypothetical protein [Bacteroidota bacterium]